MDAGSLEAGAGSADELAALLAQSGWLAALARRLIAEPGAAEDLVQETWATVLARRARPAGDVRAWLAAVMRNLARDRARSEGARRRREERSGRERESARALPTPDELAESLEGQKLLVDALRELAEPYRSTVLLHYHEGQSSAEIARRLATPEGTVRWRLKTGLDELRARLDARSDGDRRRWHVLLAPLASRHEVVAAGGATALVALLVSMKTLLVGVLLVGSFLVFQVVQRNARSAAPDLAAKPAESVTYAPLAQRATPPVVSAREALAATESGSASRTLPPGIEPAKVRVRVLDEQGSPLAGILFAQRTPWPEGSVTSSEPVAARTPALPQEAYTDARGCAELALADGFGGASSPGESLPASFERRFELVSPLHASRRLTAQLRPGAAVDLGDVRLTPGGAVHGLVVDERGLPLANVEVWHFGEDLPRGELAVGRGFFFPLPDDVRTTSDARGEFELAGLPLGWVRLAARADGFAPDLSGAIDVRAGLVASGVTLTLRPIAPDTLLCGTVVTPTGEPAAFAQVSFRSRKGSHQNRGSTTTDARGRFELEGDEDAEWQLFAYDRSGRHGGSETRTARAGGAPLELRLRARVELPLRVRDERGAPIAGPLTAWVLGPEGGSVCYAAEPRGEGELVVVPPSERFALRFAVEGFEALELDDLTAESLPAEVVLTRAPALGGRVLADGAPLAGATLTAFPVAPHAIEHDGFPVRVVPEPVGRASSGADGTFSLPLTFRGTVWVRASAPGFAPSDSGPWRAGDAAAQALEFRLDAGGALEGRVLVAEGSPAGIIVGVSRGDGFARSVRADAEGRFRFDGLCAGAWHVKQLERELSELGHATSENRHEPPLESPADCWIVTGRTTRFDLDLGGSGEPCELVGQLLVDGAPLTGWSGALVDLSDHSSGTTFRLGSAGDFRLTQPEPGVRRLVLTALEGPCADLRVVDELTLTRGPNTWSATLSLGTVVASGFAGDTDSRQRPVLLVELADGRCAVRPLVSAAPTLLPAGHVTVRQSTDPTDDPRAWPILAEGELAPGATLRLEP